MTWALIYSALIIGQMTILKCLNIFAWPRMAMVDDDFMAAFLQKITAFFTTLVMMSRLHISEYQTNVYVTVLRGEQYEAKKGPIEIHRQFNLM